MEIGCGEATEVVPLGIALRSHLMHHGWARNWPSAPALAHLVGNAELSPAARATDDQDVRYHERVSTGSVGVFTVATNVYFDYWRDMVLSADRYLFPDQSVTFHVFTDQPNAVSEVQEQLHRAKVVAIEVPPYGWPEATLFRYRFAVENSHLLRQDVLMHLDADMLVVDSVGPGLDPASWINGLAFVRHPGFRRPTGWRSISYYAAHLRAARIDYHARRSIGALGAWEQRPESTAFVNRDRRDHYVYGAIWMGRREPLLAMCRDLDEKIRRDLSKDLIAEWHDESHLNRYAADHPHTLLDCEYCYVEGWKNLAGLTPKIRVVDKGTHLTR